MQRQEWARCLKEAGERYVEAIRVYRKEATMENGRRVSLMGKILDEESRRIEFEMGNLPGFSYG